MYSYNRVSIIGYQTQPVTVRQTPGGTSVTDLNLVVPYNFKSQSGEHLEGKGFHTVTLWGSMADIAGQFIRPGSHVFISGRLQTDSWEDQQSGEKRSKTKVVGMDLIMLDPKDGQQPSPEGAPLITSSLNRADIVGNITRDPEMRTTTGGQNVVTIGVATNERWKDKSSGEDKERSEFHNVVLWGEMAEQASKSLRKGSRVYVSGRVQTRSWETQSGSKRTTTEIIADQVSLLGIRSKAAMEAVQNDGAGYSQAPRSSEMPDTQDINTSSPIPQVEYASEIKVEDLPF